MNTRLQSVLTKAAKPAAVLAAAFLGWQIADSPPPALPAQEGPREQAAAPKSSGETPAPAHQEAQAGAAAPVLPGVAAVTPDISTMSLDELRVAWNEAPTMAVLDAIAAELAARNTADSASLLMAAIGSMDDWPSRAALSKNLRAVSDPQTLPALLPALLNNYGRGNTILNEIADAIGRMAQPDTVEALAVMHWQASTQAGQGHKIIRTVAGIRNEPAKRALSRLAQRAESPALAAAAEEALKHFPASGD